MLVLYFKKGKSILNFLYTQFISSLFINLIISHKYTFIVISVSSCHFSASMTYRVSQEFECLYIFHFKISYEICNYCKDCIENPPSSFVSHWQTLRANKKSDLKNVLILLSNCDNTL